MRRAPGWRGRIGTPFRTLKLRATRPYYESWTAALTDLVVDLGVAGTDEVDSRAAHVEA
jgi:nitrile hydratase beta subunit-like protein